MKTGSGSSSGLSCSLDVSWMIRGTFSLAVCVLSLSTLAGADTEVSCVFMQGCVLPCSFQSSTDAVVHWFLTPHLTVHSHYQSRDQLTHQDQRFTNRTSLFKDQISRGNASLWLTGVQVQDEGRYKCYTSSTRGNKETFVKLQVDAPVNKVNIEQEGNRITCSSEGIYPKPELSWSTNPPSSTTFSSTTTVHQTEQQLYNISSSLTVSDTDVVYSCTVSSRRNWRRTTLGKMSSIRSSSSETTIPCSASNTSLTGFSLTWRFNRRQVVLRWTNGNYTVSEQWRQQVRSVSESGGLTLHDLSTKQEGTYSCELSDDKETYTSNILLKIDKGSHTGITVVVVVGALVVALTAVWYFSRRHLHKNSAQGGQTDLEQNDSRNEKSQSVDEANATC